MYGATLGSLIGILMYLGGSAFAYGLCLVAFFLASVPKYFLKASIYFALASMIFSAISGGALTVLLLSGVYPTNQTIYFCIAFIPPLLIAAIIYRIGRQRSKRAD
jgi:hypothetical protein